MSYHKRITVTTSTQLPTCLDASCEFPEEIARILAQYQQIHRHRHAAALRDLAVKTLMQIRAEESLGGQTLWSAARLTEHGLQFAEGKRIEVPYEVLADEDTSEILSQPKEVEMTILTAQREARTGALNALMLMNARFLRDWYTDARPILENGAQPEAPAADAAQNLDEHFSVAGPQSVVNAYKAAGIEVTNEQEVVSGSASEQLQTGVKLRIRTAEATGDVCIVQNPATGETDIDVELDDQPRENDVCERIAHSLGNIAVFGLRTAALPTFRRTLDRQTQMKRTGDRDADGHAQLQSPSSATLPLTPSSSLRN